MKFIDIFLVIFQIVTLCLIFLILTSNQSKNKNLIEVSWLNYHCAATPWSFCPKFSNIYKLVKNDILELYPDREKILNVNDGLLKPRFFNKFVKPNKLNGDLNSPPFVCVNFNRPYCRKLGQKVLISLPSSISSYLNNIEVKYNKNTRQDYFSKKKCLVSNHVINYVALNNLKKLNFDCEIVNSKQSSKNNICAWKEDRQLLVYETSNAKDLYTKEVKFIMGNKEHYDYDVSDCFRKGIE